MTAFAVEFDPFSQPEQDAPSILRNGRYYLPPLDDPTGKPKGRQRVTNFVKTVSDVYALQEWEKRRVVAGLALREDLYDLSRATPHDDRAALDDIVRQAQEAAKVNDTGGGTDTGTALHGHTEQLDRGQPVTARVQWRNKITNYGRALVADKLTVVEGMIERRIVCERFGLAGTFDRILIDRFGRLLMGDGKSQRKFYSFWEVAIQLGIYAHADAIWDEDSGSYIEMPKVDLDTAVVAWFPMFHPSGVEGHRDYDPINGDVDRVDLIDVDIARGWEAADLVERVLRLRRDGTKWGRLRPLMSDEITTTPRWAQRLREANTRAELNVIWAEAVEKGEWTEALQEVGEARYGQLPPGEKGWVE